MSAVRSWQSKVDVIEIAHRFAKHSERLWLRFVAAVEQACDQLAEMPSMGAPLEGLPSQCGEIRFWPIKGFRRHHVFYREKAGRVEVLRIVDCARDVLEVLRVWRFDDELEE